MKGIWVIIWLLLCLVSTAAEAAEAPIDTERLFLSGANSDKPVPWKFWIDRGRRAGERTTIPVPSQWELAGFGEYAYGQDDAVRAEIGRYEVEFEVPASWRERRIRLVFEGVMTDTRAALNDVELDPVHRGGFTRFSYPVADHLVYGGSNRLRVEVSEASADGSVERAERQADYWVFGGIYRPVYLEARPARAIEHVAIDARHDGQIRVAYELGGELGGERAGCRVEAEVLEDAAGSEGNGLQSLGPGPGGRRAGELSGVVAGIRPWSAEDPVLYTLALRLFCDGQPVHRVAERFGFRTVEVRLESDRPGLYVNGRRVLLKGVNRHAFHPASGRALSPRIDRADVAAIRGMNANAVRTSHYPPDTSFLEACDRAGLYVIDELPGWHDAYRPARGAGLIAEMVRRDVNHPSVILWANGNEGGWNSLLDREFARHDPQGRPVLHPDATFSGIAAPHYPSYRELVAWLDDAPGAGLGRFLGRARFGPARSRPLVLPTEMLHGLYDGGLGAGLRDFWQAIAGSARGVGAFLWAFLDEGVERTDREGAVDTFGNYAPDGILDPYRKPEASYATVRRVWSPVEIRPSGAGGYRVENRFDTTDLDRVAFRWQALALPGPGQPPKEPLAVATVPGPPTAPGATVEVRPPPAVTEIPGADALGVTAIAPGGREIETWVFSLRSPSELAARWLGSARSGDAAPSTANVVTGAVPAELPFSGPVEALGSATAAEARWRPRAAGWHRLELELAYAVGPGVADFAAAGLSLPELAAGEPVAVEWLGRGPWPVWRNRREGGWVGVWRRALPAAAGFYDDVSWLRLELAGGVLTVLSESGGLAVGVSSPGFPDDARSARAEVPPPDQLTLAARLPGMGSKFHPARDLERPDHEESSGRTARAVVWFRFEPSVPDGPNGIDGANGITGPADPADPAEPTEMD